VFSALRQKLFGESKVSKTVDSRGEQAKISANGKHAKGHNSGNEAKSRLTFCLSQDRTGLNGDEMAKFKKELVSLIQRYFIVDEDKFGISYERKADTTTLLINSPVVVKRDRKEPAAGRTVSA
jgi:cell division topological specificity factor MinE